MDEKTLYKIASAALLFDGLMCFTMFIATDDLNPLTWGLSLLWVIGGIYMAIEARDCKEGGDK